MKTNRIAASLVLAGTLFTATSQAATYSWNFDTPTGNQGYSHTYLDNETGTNGIGAYGWTTTNTPLNPGTAHVGQVWDTGSLGNGLSQTNLYGKHTNGDPGETGLGLSSGDSEHEISNNQLVQMDVTSLKSKNFTDLQFTISSVQSGEGYFLWGSNQLGGPMTLIHEYVSTGKDIDTVGVGLTNFQNFNYFAVSATGGNVLMQDGLEVTNDAGGFPTDIPNANTPEPGTLAMLAGMGATGFGMLKRRRKLAK